METFPQEVFNFVFDVQFPQLIPDLRSFFVCAGVYLGPIRLSNLLDSLFGPSIPRFRGVVTICCVSPFESVFFFGIHSEVFAKSPLLPPLRKVLG